MYIEAVSPNPPSAAVRGIRVFIAEDHAITLWGLQRLIESSRPCLDVVGTANSCAQLINHPALADTDVLLLDLDLAGQNATELMSDLLRRCPGKVLVLTGEDDVAQHRAAVMKGARGVVHKSRPASTIIRAIECVHAGEVWLERSLLGEVLGLLTGSAPAPRTEDSHARRIASLTPREREIVSTMVHSASAKQLAVASDLSMSEHTLRNHLTTIYAKLAVRGRLELHVYATEHGLGVVDGVSRK